MNQPSPENSSRPATRQVTGREFVLLGHWLLETGAEIYAMEPVGNGSYKLFLRYPGDRDRQLNL